MAATETIGFVIEYTRSNVSELIGSLYVKGSTATKGTQVASAGNAEDELDRV